MKRIPKRKMSRRRFIKTAVAGASLSTLGSASGCHFFRHGGRDHKEYDLLIASGTVFDGLGNPGRELDVAVRAGKIVALGLRLDPDQAREVISAKGLAVAPGFIDAHSHTTAELLVNLKAESQVRQGVTTEISGNCGDSPFPVAAATLEESRQYYRDEYDLELDWTDMAGFFARLEKNGMALNYATLLGQGSLRGAVVGLNDRPATAAEMEKMRRLVDAHLRGGAFGLSSGLIYPPGSFATTAELCELCRPVARRNGVYATHMRNEGEKLLEAMDEALTIARRSGVRLQISHLKTSGQSTWGKIEAALAKLDAAAREGIRIGADRYPYIAGATGLSSLFPQEVRQGTDADFIARLRDPAWDARLRENFRREEEWIGSWDKVVISSVFSEKSKDLEGKSVLAAARSRGQECYEFMRDLLIAEQNRVGMISFSMSEENLRRVLAHPLAVVGSDGSVSAPYGVLAKGKPHPRLYGTFARILGKYVRQEKVLTLERAIKKMTSQTARTFGLDRRGQVREGYHADLVVFDPDRVEDTATWENPQQYPRGIHQVVVNGLTVVREGEHTGRLPGRILKKT